MECIQCHCDKRIQLIKYYILQLKKNLLSILSEKPMKIIFKNDNVYFYKNNRLSIKKKKKIVNKLYKLNFISIWNKSEYVEYNIRTMIWKIRICWYCNKFGYIK